MSHLAGNESVDRDWLSWALSDADVPTLVMAMVHMTGDLSLIRGRVRPTPLTVGDPLEDRLPEVSRDHLRGRAVTVLNDFLSNGAELAPIPDAATVEEMMAWYVGQPMDPEYVPMIMEELNLSGSDSRSFAWSGGRRPDTAEKIRVLVIGAGVSGLLAAKRLKEAGIPFTIVEKNSEIGGTWYENQYPGCRVDVANHFYSYSFYPNSWSEYFSQRDELFDYLAGFVDHFGLREHVQFSTEVLEARYQRGSWDVDVRSGDGRVATEQYEVVISAVGQLNRPNIPYIEGSERFHGKVVHTATWDRDYDYAGKRIAVIGTGASALQLVPELAKSARHTFVFQRGRNWMNPNPAYHAPVSPSRQWVLDNVPLYARWYRFLLLWSLADQRLPSIQIDPEWPFPERSINQANDRLRERLSEYMRTQVLATPGLFEKVLPDYPPGGKRFLQDNGSWLRTLQQSNVSLINDRIVEIDESGITDGSGSHHEVDLIVYATGFAAGSFLSPMRVIGKDGSLLSDTWADSPSAYLGISVPGYPNFFCMYGPGTNLGHGGSMIFQSECQIRHILDCLRELIEADRTEIECRSEVCTDYMSRLRAAQANTVWAHRGVRSWYQNSKGLVVTNSPWRLVDYWAWTSASSVADYEFS